MHEEKNDDVAADGRLKRKEYEQELARLYVEFVRFVSRISIALNASMC